MKTLFQIVVAMVLLVGTVQAGRAAIKHYGFVDAVHEAMIFASSPRRFPTSTTPAGCPVPAPKR